MINEERALAAVESIAKSLAAIAVSLDRIDAHYSTQGPARDATLPQGWSVAVCNVCQSALTMADDGLLICSRGHATRSDTP